MTVLGARTGTAVLSGPRGDLELAWGVATDIGLRREANEDSALAQPPLFAVADGMGGHAAGDRASHAVVTRLAEAADASGPELAGEPAVETALAALDRAAADIDALGAELPLGAGTTVAALVLALDEDGAPVGELLNIGDSRVYRFARNELRQATVDHSVVQELVDAGLLDPALAEDHPEANVITRALGFHEPPAPDRIRLALETGMRLLLCSDGLTREVGAERIRLHLAAGLAPASTAAALVDAALAAGGRDNVTVLVVDIVHAP
ncbi:PP2C family protein-serine/threonine phosphatase [Homoserinibacter sp. YIM 151385]|uniref:PP2C family protein-serine/threonine phosphatase n=1 Tax=Homoserinibacter sp. YIM 151385 TaxID=2985506 RepID=UPI0022F0636D|nr:protein phosphatase 2C domain-containing protein [Homoserinibacter sp. YIM 151385]WBU38306.1 protein phosphatase 2C domain-containing protein [Homoserinibacter sp. YIM 151385]